jgi:hypothetical protein
MWDPQRLTTLWACMACYRDSFTFLLLYIYIYIYIHFFFQLNPCSHSPYITSSNKKMALSFTNMLGLSSSTCIAHIACYWKFFLLNYIQVLCLYRLCKANHAYLILCYNSSLVTWTVVSLTTAKFKPLIFSMSGFALFYTENMFIFMILYDFCLLPAQFSYIIIYIWKAESHVQIADRCASWYISSYVENVVL